MKSHLLKRCFLFLTLPTLAFTAMAEVTLPPVLGNGMVLQRDLPVPVWGWADAGEKVSVTFADQTKITKAGDDGKWMVKLDPLKASNKAASEPASRLDSGYCLHRFEKANCFFQQNMQLDVIFHVKMRVLLPIV